jgi:hypothetical protein
MVTKIWSPLNLVMTKFCLHLDDLILFYFLGLNLVGHRGLGTIHPIWKLIK